MANSALNSIMKTLLSSDAVTGISSTSGASSNDVMNVLSAALPSLLSGANTQATQKSTASSFVEALTNHAESDTSNLTSFFKNVDVADGTKIVKHLLGADTTATTKEVAKSSGLSTKQVTSIISAAAPLLLSLLGQQTKKKAKKETSTDVVASLASSLLLGGGKLDAGSIIKSLLK